MWIQVARVAAVAPSAGNPAVAVSPGPALLDKPVDVRVTGVPPHRKLALVATTRELTRAGWRSRRIFESSRGGVVDTHRGDAPAQVTGRTVASTVFAGRLDAAGVTSTDTTLAREGF